jgi:hypothetical protein
MIGARWRQCHAGVDERQTTWCVWRKQRKHQAYGMAVMRRYCRRVERVNGGDGVVVWHNQAFAWRGLTWWWRLTWRAAGCGMDGRNELAPMAVGMIVGGAERQ